MKLLAIDPGTESSGFVIIDTDDMSVLDRKLESIALANTVLSENDVTQKEKIICG